MRVGFAGVGRMGQLVCANMVRPVTWSRRGTWGLSLRAWWRGGGRGGAAPAEVAAEAEVLITCCPAPRNCTMSCSCPAVRWHPCPGSHLDRDDQYVTDRGEASRRGCRGPGNRCARCARRRRDPGCRAGTLQMFVGGDADRRNPPRQGTIRRTPRYWEVPQRPAQTPGLTGLDAAKPRTPGILATSPA